MVRCSDRFDVNSLRETRHECLETARISGGLGGRIKQARGGPASSQGVISHSGPSLLFAAPLSARFSVKSVKHENQQIRARTRRLTVCLFLLVGAISSLTPFLTLHLTNSVGLLLFESDLLQLRSSLITVIICLALLVILDLIVILFSRGRGQNQSGGVYLFALSKRRSLLLQKLLKRCSALFAITSILAYLSLALVVPHVHQQQRTPYATFDCNANLITIENCQQQFATTRGGQDSLLDSIKQLILGDLNGNGGRLANKLECLKYNDESFRVPSRFLLSKCGLVCAPQRQQLHQFGDDLNSDLGQVNRVRSPLVAPYSKLDFDQQDSHPAINDSQAEPDTSAQLGDQFVSLKLCFSGEISGEPSSGRTSNYMRFCIENLTSGQRSSRTGDHDDHESASYTPFSQSHQRRGEQTLTVGQLNAILSHKQPVSNQQSRPSSESLDSMMGTGRGDQSTHYVNPIVQFESHFKNWPHLSRASASFASENVFGRHSASGNFDGDKSEGNDHRSSPSARLSSLSWCKFKPIPPFIVNNKPFSDIHCSLEHDYLMSTGSHTREHRRRRRLASSPKIYLRKSSSPTEFEHSERCNIGCQLNVLYRAHHQHEEASSLRGHRTEMRPSGLDEKSGSTLAKSYYLPLKSCLIVQGDKDRTSQYYLWCRATADASLLMTFILVDILLMIESIDTKQFQLEGKKVRLLGLLIAIILLPLLVAALFDLTAAWLPSNASGQSMNYREGHLMQFINNRVIPAMSETFAKLEVHWKPPALSKQSRQEYQSRAPSEDPGNMSTTDHVSALPKPNQDHVIIDNYLVPFFIYAILMFAFAINSFKVPIVASTLPLVRVTSTEELGMIGAMAESSSLVRKRTSSNGTCRSKNLEALGDPVGISKSPPTPNTSSAKSKLASLKRSVTNSISQKTPSPMEKTSRHKPAQSSTRSVVLFAMLTLFMGLQFNLSQITQTQILIETFNIQNDLNQQQQLHSRNVNHNHQEQRPGRVATSFVLVANSCGTMFVLIIALLFSDELSVFMGQLFPFKPTPRLESDLSWLENSVRFKKFLSASLIIYAIRYFVLANMSAQMSKLKWVLVILFQSTELLNFPLTWFELASRAHELLLLASRRVWPNGGVEGKQLGVPKRDSRPDEQADDTGSSKTSNTHILIQSSLAFVYFALARLLALFVHSLHASLYLHSENVEWFIGTLYGAQGSGGGIASNDKLTGDKRQANATLSSHTDSLFIPLPSERQTYLHASRSFVKYNSLVCLLAGLGLLLVFGHERYQLWTDQKRLELKQRRAEMERRSGRESDLIDERLSLDLMQVHSQPAERLRRHRSETTVFTHLPKPIKRPRGDIRRTAAIEPDNSTTELEEDQERPRARIHFRYDLGRGRNVAPSDSSSVSSTSSSAGAYYPSRAQRPTQPNTTATRATSHGHNLHPEVKIKHARQATIPVILEEEPVKHNEEAAGAHEREQTSTEEEVEQFTHTRISKMLVTDEEEWSLGDDQPSASDSRAGIHSQMEAALAAARSPPPPGFADDDNDHDDDARATLELHPPPEFDELPPDEQHHRATTRAPPSADYHQQRKRITFGPTTTFSGLSESGDHRSSASSAFETTPSVVRRSRNDVSSSAHQNRFASGRHHYRSEQTTRALASPEPSIEGDDNCSRVDHLPGEFDNSYRRETIPRVRPPFKMTPSAGGTSSAHSGRVDELDSIDY